jgi:flagellar motility protein MotE (MotC chaperone)
LKASFLYILTFIVAFLAVTGLLIIANERFQNIFKFDFSPVETTKAVQPDTSNQINFTESKVLQDSVPRPVESQLTVSKDTLNVQRFKTDSLATRDEKKQVNQPSVTNQPVQTAQAISEEKTKTLETNLTSKTPDSTYNKWKKATVRIYEAMDSRKVAQVLTGLSDSEARELIYSMKKKKAAEILSNLSADAVKRLTRVQ